MPPAAPLELALVVAVVPAAAVPVAGVVVPLGAAVVVAPAPVAVVPVVAVVAPVLGAGVAVALADAAGVALVSAVALAEAPALAVGAGVAAGFFASCASSNEVEEKHAANAATVQALLKRIMTLSTGETAGPSCTVLFASRQNCCRE